jgi:rod shape-determining protein MreD
MKYVIALLAAWLLTVLSVSAMPYLKVLGVTPDLVLIFAASWTMLRGRDEALVVVPLTGFIRDLLTADPLGTSVLALAPLVPLAAVLRLRAMDTDFVPAVALVAAGSVAYGAISMTVLSATGHEIAWTEGFLGTVLPGALVNALFTPILYLPMHWLGAHRRTGMLGSGRLAAPL